MFFPDTLAKIGRLLRGGPSAGNTNDPSRSTSFEIQSAQGQLAALERQKSTALDMVFSFPREVQAVVGRFMSYDDIGKARQQPVTVQQEGALRTMPAKDVQPSLWIDSLKAGALVEQAQDATSHEEIAGVLEQVRILPREVREAVMRPVIASAMELDGTHRDDAWLLCLSSVLQHEEGGMAAKGLAQLVRWIPALSRAQRFASWKTIYDVACERAGSLPQGSATILGAQLAATARHVTPPPPGTSQELYRDALKLTNEVSGRKALSNSCTGRLLDGVPALAASAERCQELVRLLPTIRLDASGADKALDAAARCIWSLDPADSAAGMRAFFQVVRQLPRDTLDPIVTRLLEARPHDRSLHAFTVALNVATELGTEERLKVAHATISYIRNLRPDYSWTMQPGAYNQVQESMAWSTVFLACLEHADMTENHGERVKILALLLPMTNWQMTSGCWPGGMAPPPAMSWELALMELVNEVDKLDSGVPGVKDMRSRVGLPEKKPPLRRV